MKIRFNAFAKCLMLLGFILAASTGGRAGNAEKSWWSKSLSARLDEAGTNRAEIVKCLETAPEAQREGIAFLVENMPKSDLRTLSSGFLIENLKLAYEAWSKSPWHSKVSKELFLNDVLPYASLTEPRDPWRRKLQTLCAPMVTQCKTAGEAAQILNQKIFPELSVRYNTGRKHPDQSPDESIKSGMATCSGLSILLVDACRSIGVPARVAGTPMWSNMRGNHTWVEVWDGGWHFAGAAEPDPAGLDHGWFVHDASEAKRDVPQHSIYASSFKPTGVYFPLVWAQGDKSVNAVNVTDRYAANATPPSAGKSSVNVSVKVLAPNGKRVVSDIIVSDVADASKVLKAKSRGETADLNDFAAFQLQPGRKYHIGAQQGQHIAGTDVTIGEAAEQLITLTLPEQVASAAPYCAVRPPPVAPLAEKDAAALKTELAKYFAADHARREKWKFATKFERLLKQNEAGTRLAVWDAYRQAPIHAELKSNFDAKLVKAGGYESPYTLKEVGTRPANGWALFIAMHGGGGAPKEVNDSQWKHMQIYYKDHPEAGGYLYLALRAPNDTWNGFYDDYVYPLIDQLILQFRLFGDIDPDKVFIMGYSHGGYGAYAIGPKMPDRFAEIHASAAAATDGETTAKTLRTTPFTVMVGEKDTMYGRYERNLKFKEQVEKLRGDRKDIYPVTVTIIAGNGHTGLPDRDLIPKMYPSVRDPVPREVDWLMTDNVVKDLFWLSSPQPSKEQEIFAVCRANKLTITASEKVNQAAVYLDSRLVDFARPVTVELNGASITRRFKPGLKTLCETIARRGDPDFGFVAGFTFARDTRTGKFKVTNF